jgi:hypothetical protein
MFPQKNWLGLNKGWEDLGEKESHNEVVVDNRIMRTITVHDFCGSIVHLGKEENGKLFMFCSKCLIKITY